MIRKKGAKVFFILGLLFLFACTPATQSSSIEGAYAGCYGDDPQMVTATFAAFAPVSSETAPYHPGEEIDIQVDLVNQNTQDIDDGNAKIKLTGDAAVSSIFSGAEVKSTSTTLYAIDPETCLTDTSEVEIGPLKYQGEITTQISKEITGLYCYEAPVVVKAFLYFTDDSANIGDNLPSGSNPPSSVQVTKIEQNPVDVDRESNTAQLRLKLYLENVGTGTIVENLDSCFEYRDASYQEEFSLSVDGAYTIECPDTVKLSRAEKLDVVTCKVTGIDVSNLGSQPSEMTITLSNFAYEDTIPSTTIWLEP